MRKVMNTKLIIGLIALSNVLIYCKYTNDMIYLFLGDYSV
jgi:hypothetical protein